jgi:phosphoribosylanthranilate isomerase
VSLWVKICANTSLADARLAAEAGADAIGFVFAPSPRQVTAAQVALIAPRLAPVETIGVFVDTPLDRIIETVERCHLTGVQLHREVGNEAPSQLRQRFGTGFRILRVVHFAPDAPQMAAAIARDPNVDAILVDSRTPTAAGGTGIAFDWQQARNTLFGTEKAGERRLVAAGGLTPGNVAEAIVTLHPWGVDVVSGVEQTPGRKDPDKLRAFIANARAATKTAQTI